jgi:uncharacterized protein (DUF2384 family)
MTLAVSSDISGTYAIYLDTVQATVEERMERVRRGLLPTLIMQLAHDLRIPDHHLAHYLGLNRATLRRKIAEDERLGSQESEGLLAMVTLAGSVITASRQPSVMKAVVVDPLGWFGRWMRTPMVGLEGRAPIQYMDVVEGRALVASWLAGALNPEGSP